MINCIIVDDEPLAQQVLERHLKQLPVLHLVKICSNALEAFEVLTRDNIDLVFLDVKLPALNGTDFIRSLSNPPAVIFTTAYPDYAVVSYELNSVDYLLKPVTFERFKQSVDKFLKIHRPGADEKTYSFFKIDGKLVKIQHADIFYAQSVKDYIIIATQSKKYMVHLTMKLLEELLPPPRFMRVHRSYLVGISHIETIGKSGILLQGFEVPVGGNYRSSIEALKNRLRGR